MRRVTIDVDEWTLQAASAALGTTSTTATIERALVVATEEARRWRLAQRHERLAAASRWPRRVARLHL